MPMGLVGMFWNEGGAYVFYAESPGPPVPAAGHVTLEHVAPVPRQFDGSGRRAALEHEHRVAIAVKAVLLGDGPTIGGEDRVPVCKRGDEHQQ
jgi:hypothetical protein